MNITDQSKAENSAKYDDEVIVYIVLREDFLLKFKSAFQTVKSIRHCNQFPRIPAM